MPHDLVGEDRRGDGNVQGRRFADGRDLQHTAHPRSLLGVQAGREGEHGGDGDERERSQQHERPPVARVRGIIASGAQSSRIPADDKAQGRPALKTRPRGGRSLSWPGDRGTSMVALAEEPIWMTLALFLGACATSAPSRPPIEPVVGATQSGEASWYGAAHQGRRTSSGEPFDMSKLTAGAPHAPPRHEPARHEPGEWAHGPRPGERSRPLGEGPRHRPVLRRGGSAGLRPRRPHPRSHPGPVPPAVRPSPARSPGHLFRGSVRGALRDGGVDLAAKAPGAVAAASAPAPSESDGRTSGQLSTFAGRRSCPCARRSPGRRRGR